MRITRNKLPRAEIASDKDKKEADEKEADNEQEIEEEVEEKEEVSGKRLEQAALLEEEEEEEEEDEEDVEDVGEVEVKEEEDSIEEVYRKTLEKVSDEARVRQTEFIKRHRGAVNYKFDTKNSEWCEFEVDTKIFSVNVMLCSVIEELANKALVWSTPDIKRALVNTQPDDKGRLVITTEGINIREMWRYDDIVDTKDIYTNDVNKLYACYGIEAAMSCLVQEISSVFGAYGIDVDARHLTLIAEYMTQHGAYRAFNRIGIRGNTSPLQKMTFETCMEFLRRAAFYNESDILDSPSSCIVTGKVGNYGTGICEIRQPLTLQG